MIMESVMGGCSIEDDMENFDSALTLVLVGKTGNGKSATGNSIIGSKEFESKRNSGGVTLTSELKTTKLEDGRILNVIDTPGLFDSSAKSEFISKEIVRCVNMARDGIHSVLVVFSVLSRFSEEEKAVLSCLDDLFGSKIYEYVIIVFTGGDELEEDGKSLEDFLRDCPQELKETLSKCGNRYVLFDNRTKDQAKKKQQLEQLLSYVNEVLQKNDGEPYTNEIFTEFKREMKELKELMEKQPGLKNTQFVDLEMLEHIENRIIEKLKLMEKILTLEKKLLKAHDARAKAEENAKEQREKAEKDLNELKEKLEEVDQKLQKKWCVIM